MQMICDAWALTHYKNCDKAEEIAMLPIWQNSNIIIDNKPVYYETWTNAYVTVQWSDNFDILSKYHNIKL